MGTIRSALLSMTMLMVPDAASAQDVMYEGIHGFSSHIPRYQYQNANIGRYVIERSGLTYGSLYNSYGLPSAYVGQYFKGQTALFGEHDIVTGVATGYPGKELQGMVMYTKRFNVTAMSGLRLFAGVTETQSKLSLLFHVSYEWQP